MDTLLFIKAAQVVLSIIGCVLLASMAFAFGRSPHGGERVTCIFLLASCIAINVWAVLT
jgi:hypothetical protein